MLKKRGQKTGKGRPTGKVGDPSKDQGNTRPETDRWPGAHGSGKSRRQEGEEPPRGKGGHGEAPRSADPLRVITFWTRANSEAPPVTSPVRGKRAQRLASPRSARRRPGRSDQENAALCPRSGASRAAAVGKAVVPAACIAVDHERNLHRRQDIQPRANPRLRGRGEVRGELIPGTAVRRRQSGGHRRGRVGISGRGVTTRRRLLAHRCDRRMVRRLSRPDAASTSRCRRRHRTSRHARRGHA